MRAWLRSNALLPAHAAPLFYPPPAAAAVHCGAAEADGGRAAGGGGGGSRAVGGGGGGGPRGGAIVRLVVALDWRSSGEVALVCNALTELIRARRDTGRGAPPPLRVELVGRSGSPG